MRVKRLEHFMGEGWQLRSAGGATGEAYIAEQGEQKLFIKRNSSPFLAVLSAEGIVPKLLWTKRLENGDVITAQQWVDRPELKSYEMNHDSVASLLSKIHRSKELLDMFMRMGNRPLSPTEILANLDLRTRHLQESLLYVKEAMQWLTDNFPVFYEEKCVVCHSDVNHNNWINNEDGSLFLIDWDGAQVADPALDLAPLLYLYVPKQDWEEWLKGYGEELSEDLTLRMQWHMVVQCIDNILWFWKREETANITKWSHLLDDILQERT
ncbi:phosphotransferase [Salipaludibacillus neizhouensis]|uniref:Phosphotransferase n=1 Tax=Salipaludibacillus neizhouensis TaxID=885475 RepID=A0A3A9KGQ2_9BACI|nr:phosphotransferase family protein [Salipaludibacillus neizhouensis]RKL66775.1 phosphotransferase [Salipaludibacillus neizhouensis]